MNTASPSTVSSARAFLHRLGFHRWRTIEDTGLHWYQQCDICQKRRIVSFGGRNVHQPKDTSWIATGKFRQWGPPRATIRSGAQPPVIRVEVIDQRADQVGPVELRRERIE